MTQPIRRRRGLTEQAAAAAIDTTYRQLRLPTVRGVHTVESFRGRLSGKRKMSRDRPSVIVKSL